MTPQAILPGEPMVQVRQVINRPEKDDCRAGTAVVWHGPGDIQLYPRRLWPFLAPHPDVWELVDTGEAKAESRRQISERLMNERLRHEQAITHAADLAQKVSRKFEEADREASLAELAMQQAKEAMAAFELREAEELGKFAAEDAALEQRRKDEVARIEAEAAARRQAEAQAVLDAQKRTDAEAAEAARLAEEAKGKGTDTVVIASTLVQYTAEQLLAMSDEDVRAEAIRRDYPPMHARLKPETLRQKFLEAQITAAEIAAADAKKLKDAEAAAAGEGGAGGDAGGTQTPPQE